MKFASLKTSLITCICIFELISHLNAQEDALEKVRDVFSKRLLKEIGSHLLKSNRNDTECIRDINLWYRALKNQTSLWPFQMLDSWGKIPVGILTSNINYSLGQFDECVNVKHLHIKGKYCIAEFSIIPIIQSLMLFSNEIEKGDDRIYMLPKNLEISYKSGVCFPNSCKRVDIENLLKMIFNVFDFKPDFSIQDDSCSTNDPVKWRNIDWIAFSIFMFIALLVILSSTYDLTTNFWLQKKRSGQYHKLILSFSIWSNAKQIISVNNSPRNIKCLNGLRSITVFWVILVHRFQLYRWIPVVNASDVLDMFNMNVANIIFGSQFGVDTFLVLSGCLLTYTTFNRLKKGESFDLLSFYRNRLVRITPASATVLLFFVSLFMYIGSGPLWKLNFVKKNVSNCEKYWWSTLLYVNNYFNVDNMCLGHTWYLSTDMQLFILSPLLIYPIIRWKKFGWIHTAFWVLTTQIIKYIIAYQKNLKGAIFPIDKDKIRFHYQTGTRLTPWLIGFLLGYFLHLKSEWRLKINKVVAVILWLSTLTIMGSLVFSTVHLMKFDRVVTHAEDTTYAAFSKNVWALCICWIITACAHGYGGPINWFLSLRMWEIMARFSFSIYLVHIIVSYGMSGSIRYPVAISYFEFYKLYITDVVVSIVVGYLLTILIELPFRNINCALFSIKKTVKDIDLQLPEVNETSIRK